jgi:hypothetical protein
VILVQIVCPILCHKGVRPQIHRINQETIIVLVSEYLYKDLSNILYFIEGGISLGGIGPVSERQIEHKV